MRSIIQTWLRVAGVMGVLLAALAPAPSALAADPEPGTWSATGSMSVGHWLHTATLLGNGNVLVAGGFDQSTGALASAEVYNPVSGTWSTTGSMTTPRWGHRAVQLSNGTVLVEGGIGMNTAELYDPASGQWRATGSMATGRSDATLIPLPNGKVLVAGGYNYANGIVGVATAELYDPATGSWSSAGSMASPRLDHTATLLPGGKVLVAGGASDASGSSSSVLASAELYDPTTGAWSTTGSMITPREGATASLLQTGKVLVAGGQNFAPGYRNILASAEIYDPASGTWTATGDMTGARVGHTATVLRNGAVLVAGAGAAASAELYNPSSGAWSATGSMSASRYLPTATRLTNGKVLVAGGLGSSGTLPSAEVYLPFQGKLR